MNRGMICALFDNCSKFTCQNNNIWHITGVHLHTCNTYITVQSISIITYLSFYSSFLFFVECKLIAEVNNCREKNHFYSSTLFHQICIALIWNEIVKKGLVIILSYLSTFFMTCLTSSFLMFLLLLLFLMRTEESFILLTSCTFCCT